MPGAVGAGALAGSAEGAVDPTGADPGAGPPDGLDDAERLDLFLRLSETMLDARPLRASTGRAFLRLVEQASPGRYGLGGSSLLDAVLLTFRRLHDESTDDLERRTANVLYADLTLGPVLKNVLVVWYNGGLGGAVGPPETYADALVWPAISANPPGLPGPYYGHWAYPPERPVRPPDGSVS